MFSSILIHIQISVSFFRILKILPTIVYFEKLLRIGEDGDINIYDEIKYCQILKIHKRIQNSCYLYR